MAMVGKSEAGGGRFQQGTGLRGRCEEMGRCAGARELYRGWELCLLFLPLMGKDNTGRIGCQCWERLFSTGHWSNAQQQPGLAAPKGEQSRSQVWCQDRAFPNTQVQPQSTWAPQGEGETGSGTAASPRHDRRQWHWDRAETEMGTGRAPGTGHIQGTHPSTTHTGLGSLQQAGTKHPALSWNGAGAQGQRVWVKGPGEAAQGNCDLISPRPWQAHSWPWCALREAKMAVTPPRSAPPNRITPDSC